MLRLGCSSGFWGDTTRASAQLVRQAQGLDFLIGDYLSEITMSLLARARDRDPAAGFVPDFVRSLQPVLGPLARQGTRVVTNAGGMNPEGCADALRAELRAAGVRDARVAVVTGDDLLAGAPSADPPLPPADRLLSANAYLGAGPIRQALDDGADFVITGRCVDSALALGPLMHRFGWGAGDLDQLSGGSLAGHVVECGAQATGGIATDWERSAAGFGDMGFPVVDVSDDGAFEVSKPPATGGRVDYDTVCEQILYEVGDPGAYVLPDVVCDWTQVRVQPVGADRVRVAGARGRAPPRRLKGSATFRDGFRAVATVPLLGGRAAAKARATGEGMLARARSAVAEAGLGDFSAVNLEVLGSDEAHQAVLWLAAAHPSPKALQLFAAELAHAGTGMAPGVTGLPGGRPKPSPVVRLHSFYVPREDVAVEVDGAAYSESSVSVGEEDDGGAAVQVAHGPPRASDVTTGDVPLHAVAFTRSGDKGNDANIGVVARDPADYERLREVLTAERVLQHMQHHFDDPERAVVYRYEVPGISALNFLLKDALGGGGIASLRVDAQGKAYGQQLGDMVLW